MYPHISFTYKKSLSVSASLFLLCSYYMETALCSSNTTCKPHNCNKLNIRPPFWIQNLQELYCGSPGFNITCYNDTPVININGKELLIKDIFYENNTILLAQVDAFEPSIACPAPRSNFSVEGTPFIYGDTTVDLFFFYNCTKAFDGETYAVDCAGNKSHDRHAFAVFHVELLQRWNYSIGSCDAPVNAPVHSDDLPILLKMNFTDILKKGFILQWHGKSCSGERSSCHGSGKDISLGLRIGIGLSAVVLTALIMSLALFVYYRHYRKRSVILSSVSDRDESFFPSKRDLENAGIHVFDYLELAEATDKFDPRNELGDGGYGSVFKGKLKDERVVAVKRLYENHQKRVAQFVNEVEILTRMRHRNLVTLYGCTSQRSRELLLVYEYIPNGTLSDHLHGKRAKPGSLSWTKRLNIAIESAGALVYLHASDIIHRDIKSSNILLDSNYMVKVADFGLSRVVPIDATHVSTCPQGTLGYLDPEYHQYYQLTEKSDVYSFGVVLIELISSKPAIDICRNHDEINLSRMAVEKIRRQELNGLVDADLGFGSDHRVRTMIRAVAELAFECLQDRGDLRPSMEDVLSVLQEIERMGCDQTVVSSNDDILSQ